MSCPDAARHLADVDVFALTVDREASIDGTLGITAVACVIRNRVAWGRWGSSYADVCLAAKQFSCWRPAGGTTNYARLVTLADAIRTGRRPASMRTAYDIVQMVMTDSQADITNGADHYFAPAAMVPRGRVPSWAEDRAPVAAIGRHLFFRLRPGWPARIGDAVTR